MVKRLRQLIAVLSRWRYSDQAERDLHDEVEGYAQMLADDGRASGLPPEEARRLALAQLGSIASVEESVRQSRAGAVIEQVWQDVWCACRGLRRAPGLTAVAILTLALAVGANVAVLGIADAVLFRPLPYANADHLAIISMLDRPSGQHYAMTPYAYLEALDDAHSDVGEVGLLEPGPRVTIATADGPLDLRTMEATANYFSILGVRPALGRVFEAADDGREGQVAVLLYTAWRKRFGGDTSIVGRSVTLGDHTFDVVGVLPPDFMFPSLFAGRPDIVTLKAPVPRGAKGGTFDSIVRIAPGVSRKQAQAEVEAVAAPVAARLTQPGQTPVLEDMRGMLFPVGRSILQFLLAASGLVLLLGCANLANMLLVRARRTERDTALRVALGAGRVRLVRPILFEAVLIGVSGALVALLATKLTFATLLQQVPTVAYGEAHVGIDLRVGTAALLMGLISGLTFAAVPAWRAARLDVWALLPGRGSARGQPSRSGGPMVAIQVAVAVVLVFGGALAARAFVSVLRTPLGFSYDNVALVRERPPDDPAARETFYVRVVETLMRRPDVAAVGAAGSLPLSGEAPDEGAVVPERPSTRVGLVHVLPGYFEAVQMHLQRGRFLTWSDMQGDESAAEVSESAAHVMFPGRSPLNQTFTNGRGRSFRVVGVVNDVRRSLSRAEPPVVYALGGVGTRWMTVVVRTRDRRDAVLADLKREASTVGPATTSWWQDSVSTITAYRNPRFQTLVLGVFAALALGLTGLGVFAVVAYLVASRTREMGVRLAIGAAPASLMRLVIRQATVPVAVGAGIGLAATQGLGRLAEAQLYKVDTHDPVTLGAATIVVLAAAVLAAYLPARRASRVDPVRVLRAE